MDSTNRLRNMKTRLTWLQEKKLQNHLGGKQFSLLFKASVHGFCDENLHSRCFCQGPTLIVIYSSDHVFGLYIPQNDKNKATDSCLLFAFEETEILGCEIGPYNFTTIFFPIEREFKINLFRKEVKISLDTLKKLKLFQHQIISLEECEAFRCEDLLDTRKMNGVAELRENLLSAIRTYKPSRDLVNQIRILLLGPVGAGKSSFFNSVKSVFRGYVTHQAVVGSDRTGISKQYRTYSINDGKTVKPLPFILCDSVGLSEEEGLCLDDIPYILKGHVPDKYQFNFMKPITPDHESYINFLSLENRIHCVAFVFDANSIEQLSNEMVAKVKKARRKVIKCGVAPVVLLTCVDTMDLITRGDLINIYKCMPVKLKREEVHKKLGFALSDILVVSNYTSEWNLDPIKDVLNLSALRQMLWAADDFLEDLPLEKKQQSEKSISQKNWKKTNRWS
ncbi:interferon-induced protein 44 [Pipistrellus kuhlii]|uniref:Interferon-induced protein 44 n=2 Tax=Pipistrellus kuhlii TaxID=59472 RepID=A0A7J8A6T0_PIPKU|nr:interferon-induced protein 44 [Pipistrellus kuhlii]KAF6382223.1 interferon induced protein 44 [Pipistrellus kuhlii]